MLAILADDLTGALDSAAPFAGRGLLTEVALTPSAIALSLAEEPQVLAINLGTRELSRSEAHDLCMQTLALLPPQTVLFKKIDSRLKGHIEAELDAFKYKKSLIAPAIPEFSRVVIDGKIQGFGVEHPILISERLGKHAQNAFIPDTLTSDDMDKAFADAEASHVELFVGARGLAEAIARKMANSNQGKLVALPQGKGLLVIGSRDPITLDQIDNIVKTMKINHIKAPNGIFASLEAAAFKSDITLFQATEGQEKCTGQQVSNNLAVSVHPALTKCARTLLLCGGETANAVMQAMKINRFRLLGECLPGLAVANYGDQWLIAKSGGFGDPETFVHIAKQISVNGADYEN